MKKEVGKFTSCQVSKLPPFVFPPASGGKIRHLAVIPSASGGKKNTATSKGKV